MGRIADFAKKTAKRGATAAGRGAGAAGRSSGRFAKNRLKSGYEAGRDNERRKAEETSSAHEQG